MSEPSKTEWESEDEAISKRTAWTALKKEGSYFKTHELHPVHEQRMEFRPTPKMKLLAAAIFPITLIAASIRAFKDFNPDELFGLYFALIIGTVVGTLLHLLVRQMMTPAIFDFADRYYCKNWKKPEHQMHPEQLNGFIQLDDVHALQILAKNCSLGPYAYTSYELNLVLKDGSRHNVIDHPQRESIRREAWQLSDALRIPVWDAA